MTHFATRNRAHGTTLIEMLIAATILCIGLLAAGSVFVTSIDTLTLNGQKQRAQILSLNMAEAVAGLATSVDCNEQTLCTPQQMLGALLTTWQQQTRQQLPAGIGSLRFGEQYGMSVAIIDVSWETRSRARFNYQYLVAMRAQP